MSGRCWEKSVRASITPSGGHVVSKSTWSRIGGLSFRSIGPPAIPGRAPRERQAGSDLRRGGGHLRDDPELGEQPDHVGAGPVAVGLAVLQLAHVDSAEGHAPAGRWDPVEV